MQLTVFANLWSCWWGEGRGGFVETLCSEQAVGQKEREVLMFTIQNLT